MSQPLVSDELWQTIAPLLPADRPKPKGGRPRVPDRATLTGILFVLRSGIPWDLLPRRWAVAAGSPAGGGCATGSRQACGTAYTGPSWIGSGEPPASIGPAPAWTVAWSRQKGGPSHRPESDRSRAPRLQAAPAERPPGHPPGGRPQRRQLC